jgi:hypothetical protein
MQERHGAATLRPWRAHSRRERRALSHASRRVLTFAEWCEINAFSQSTGRRIINSGDGPKITQLSANRIGVREDHNAEWQDGRVR